MDKKLDESTNLAEESDVSEETDTKSGDKFENSLRSFEKKLKKQFKEGERWKEEYIQRTERQEKIYEKMIESLEKQVEILEELYNSAEKKREELFELNLFQYE